MNVLDILSTENNCQTINSTDLAAGIADSVNFLLDYVQTKEYIADGNVYTCLTVVPYENFEKFVDNIARCDKWGYFWIICE